MTARVARFLVAWIGFALLAASGAAGAVELKVFSTTALTEIWQELKPKFEARGHKLELALQPSGAIAKRVAAGEAGDAIVSTTDSPSPGTTAAVFDPLESPRRSLIGGPSRRNPRIEKGRPPRS